MVPQSLPLVTLTSIFFCICAIACFGVDGYTFISTPRSTNPSFGISRHQQHNKNNVESQPHSSRYTFMPMSKTEDDFVQAADLEGIQKLFSKYCDSDGLMTKQALVELPYMKELLEDGDLDEDELDSIWKAAPKFPDKVEAEERIDVDSFVQIYRDVDDLFEEEDEDVEVTDGQESKVDPVSSGEKASNDAEETTILDSDKATEQDEEEKELERTFETLCDKNGLLSKKGLRDWDEVQTLVQEGLLGEEEFDSIWEKTLKSPGSENEQIDVDGFLSFNVALDGLFDFDDEEVDEGDDEASNVYSEMVDDDDLSASELFDALAGEDSLVGMKELERWGELQSMLEDGDLAQEELETIFEKVTKASSNPDKLDGAGFSSLYDEIDMLFEDDDEDDEEEEEEEVADEKPAPAKVVDDSSKPLLMNALSRINSDPERLPCGLESTDAEMKIIAEYVSAVEGESTNLVRQKQGNIEVNDVAGEWELLYSSSSAMKYNQGLSGLGGSFPNGKFGGLKQKLGASKYLTDVEYSERIAVTPEAASFDVTVTGNWELRTSTSIFTGEPSIVLTVVPDKVTYGPTETRADHWKSLGPTNMLDITYLDDDLRVMRGNTSTDSIFIFRRSK